MEKPKNWETAVFEENSFSLRVFFSPYTCQAVTSECLETGTRWSRTAHMRTCRIADGGSPSSGPRTTPGPGLDFFGSGPILTRYGFPAAILRPLLRGYSGPRQLRWQGCYSPITAHEGVTILAGCANATMLTLGTLLPLLEATAARVRALTEPVLDLTQNAVDDLEYLFVGKGEPLVENVVQTMNTVEAHMLQQGLRLSERKCIVQSEAPEYAYA
eukprot:703708-Amphidinium_carterae.4